MIGRERELGLLLGVIVRPPALAVVRGEAGIGKSRVVREALQNERVRQGCVLVGRCHQLRDPFPLGPIIDALRGVGGTRVRRSLSPLAGALRPLLPELGGQLPAEPAPLADPRAQRHRIFRALRELLQAVGPVVCVLEDLHWADGGTLEFLSFLLAEPPEDLALVLTYRSDELDPSHPLFALGSRGAQEIATSTIELGPLPTDQVRALAAALLEGEQVSRDFASYLHARTGGIPFAVEEVLRLLREEGGLARVRRGGRNSELDQLQVPDAIRHSVLERVKPLSSDARSVAAAAAVLVRPAGEDLLRKVAGLSAQRAGRALTAALGARLLEEQDRALYGFRHALATSAVYEDIPPPQRQRLHLRAARALEAVPDPRPLAQIAHHFKEAGRLRQWVRYAEAAAEASHSIADDRSAAEVLEEALQAPGLTRAARVRMATRLGNAALYSPSPQTAIPALERALSEEDLAAGVRGELRFSLARLRWHAGDAACWREEMLRAVEELRRRPDLGARAMINLALPRHPPIDIRERLSWLARAEQAAARTDDAVAHIALSAQRAAILLSTGDPAGWDAAEKIPADATSVDAKLQLLRGYIACSQAALDLGHHSRAESLLARAERIQAGLGHGWLEPVLRDARAGLDCMVGRWQGLEPRMRELTELQTGRPYLAFRSKVILAWLLLRGGRLGEASATIEEAHNDARHMGSSGSPAGSMILAEMHLAEGRPEAACRASTEAMEEVLDHKGLWFGPAASGVAPEAVQILAAGGDRARAGELVRALATWVNGRDAPAAKASLSSCRGSLAQADGRPKAAALSFGHAERIWRELPAPYQAARARERRGHCLLGLDDRRAGRLLMSARDDLRALGASWDADRVEAELVSRRLVKRARWRGGRTGYRGRLSPREAEVARLAASGRTNRQIAATLVISPHTAAHHMSAVLRKLGVPSRHALGTAEQHWKDS